MGGGESKVEDDTSFGRQIYDYFTGVFEFLFTGSGGILLHKIGILIINNAVEGEEDRKRRNKW